ncbi:hypothetical protein BH09PSE1_BH09PSE1_14330 [soil metagenome]
MTQQVLIIDDDEPVLRALVGVLQNAGYTVTGYASPLKFLEDIAGLGPAILIADVRMPQMDGMTMVQAVKEAGFGDWPVILISGHADIPMAVQAMRMGAGGFFGKAVHAPAPDRSRQIMQRPTAATGRCWSETVSWPLSGPH